MNDAFSPAVSSAVAKWVIRPATRTRSPARRGRLHEGGDVLGAGAEAPHAGVELQVDAEGRPAARPRPRARPPRASRR